MRNNQNRLGHRPSSQMKAAAAHPQPDAPAASYVTPTEFVELPSKGKFYPQEHPLYNKTTIEIKYMTAREEDILASETLIKNGLVIERLMENIIADPNIDPKSLIIGDRNAVLLAARITAYGREFNANTRCLECGHVAEEYAYDLKNHSYKANFSNEDYLREHNIAYDPENRNYSVFLPKSEMNVSVKVVAISEAQQFDNINEDSAVTEFLSVFIEAVEGQYDEELVQSFVRHMPAADSRFIRNLYTELAPDIDLTQDFICPNCGHQEQKEVPLNAGFFWPE